MGRLTSALSILLLVFATSMCFIVLGVYNVNWVPSIIGVAILGAFVILGGLLVPKARQVISTKRQRSANALLQVLGAWCLLLFLVMGLISWILGNRHVSGNGYDVIGLLLFLGLLGLGVPGALFTIGRFVYLFDEENRGR